MWDKMSRLHTGWDHMSRWINSARFVGDAATLLKTEAGSLPEGKVKIRLESDGSLLDVDEDDVEKVFNHQIKSDPSSITGIVLWSDFEPQANPPMFDRVEDLASLQYLNESNVMHSLRQRYGGNLVHTHAGPNMVVVNPISNPSMYSEKVRLQPVHQITHLPQDSRSVRV